MPAIQSYEVDGHATTDDGRSYRYIADVPEVVYSDVSNFLDQLDGIPGDVACKIAHEASQFVTHRVRRYLEGGAT